MAFPAGGSDRTEWKLQVFGVVCSSSVRRGAIAQVGQQQRRMASMNTLKYLYWRVGLACLLGVCLLLPVVAAAGVSMPDNMEQRLAACSSCHGARGAGSVDDRSIPRLAGKPAAYLLKQMLYFQTGQRSHGPMEYVVRQLSVDYLRQIADYYAAQDVAVRDYPVPDVPEAVLVRGHELVFDGDPDRGVPSCVQCHGKTLTGVAPMIPGLTGLSFEYIETQLELWRAHERANKGMFCMGVVANRMRPSDIRAVSAWLASQPPPKDMHPVPASAHPAELPGWCVLDQAMVGEMP